MGKIIFTRPQDPSKEMSILGFLGLLPQFETRGRGGAYLDVNQASQALEFNMAEAPLVHYTQKSLLFDAR